MVSCSPKCQSNCVNQDLAQASIKAPVASFFPPLALPVLFKKELKDKEAEEGAAVKFQCELTKDNATVEWRKGTMQLFACAKYEIKLSGRTAELVIHNIEPEDASDYTCDTGDQQSTAVLRVNG